MRLIDLTVLLDPANREKLPPALQHAAGVVAPRIDYNNPAEQAGRMNSAPAWAVPMPTCRMAKAGVVNT